MKFESTIQPPGKLEPPNCPQIWHPSVGSAALKANMNQNVFVHVDIVYELTVNL